MSVEDLSGAFEDGEAAGEATLDTRDVIRDAMERQRAGAEPREAAAATDTSPTHEAPEAGRRDEKGRFAPRTRSGTAEPPAALPDTAAGEAASRASDPARDTAAPGAQAPAGFSAAARIAFAQAPPALREAIARREADHDAGLKRYEGLDRYLRMADSYGTSLPSALEQYTQIEDTLRKDPIAGIERIAANVGFNPIALAQAILSRSHAGGAGPAPLPPSTGPKPFDEGAITDRVLREVETRAARTSVAREIADFGGNPDNRFFNDVRATMGLLLHAGAASTLKDAYDQACWAQPTIRTQLMKSQAALPPQAKGIAPVVARGTAKAITGAPPLGVKPGAPSAASRHETALDTVRRAVQDARGAL